MNTVLGALAGALAIFCGAAAAAEYPEKPVRLLVGFSAGGSADISACAIAKKLGETLATNVVIDNRGGAGGGVAAQLVAVARPDGYTLLWGTVGALTVTQGASEILTAVISGELQTSFINVTAAGALRSRIRGLAVTSLNRDPSLPDVPSMHEAGIRNYDATFWYGLLAPAGTPAAIVDKLNRHLRAALADVEVTRPVQAQGLINNPAPSSPQEYAARIKADFAKWKKVIAGT